MLRRDLLLPYGDVVMTLSIVLRIKRTLDSDEIDKIISDVQAVKARAIEHRRRADWRKRELAAASFHAEVITRMPHRRHTSLQIGWGNQRQLGSDGAADVPSLMIFKSLGVSYRRGFF
jgi:hypothetical protein